MTELTKSEKISNAWKNGNYENVHSPSATAKRKASIKKARAEGRSMLPSELYALTKDEKYARSGKGIKHRLAKYWKLKAPTGEIVEGINLNELIRQHKHLFLPDDVVWGGPAGNQCRAACCISQLTHKKPNGEYRRNSWKGWRLIEMREVNN